MRVGIFYETMIYMYDDVGSSHYMRYGTGNLQRKAAHSQYWATTKVIIYIVVYV